MDKKVIRGFIAFVLVAVALIVALTLLNRQTINSDDTLPWNIIHPTPDTIRVMGITLGVSTLEEAEQLYKQATGISMFKSADSKFSVEAFFEVVNLGGLKAEIVLNIEIPSYELPEMFNRGSPRSSTQSGMRINLSTNDLARVRQAQIASLTYIPAVQMNEAMLIQHFGKPVQRVHETGNGAIHWLYPQHGLNIMLGGDEKQSLQFLLPASFELLSTSLLAQGEILK